MNQPMDAASCSALEDTSGAKIVSERYVVALSLAEGETLRRVIHMGENAVLLQAGLCLRDCEGTPIDRSSLFLAEKAPAAPIELPSSPSESKAGDEAKAGAGPLVRPRLVDVAVQCLRFMNCEMFFTDNELALLLHGLLGSNIRDRLAFFSESLRLRRRERHLWEDTPLAKVFTEQKNWHLLHSRALIQNFHSALENKQKRGMDVRAIFMRFFVESKQEAKQESAAAAPAGAQAASAAPALAYEDLQRMIEYLNLEFSPRDISEIVRLGDRNNSGKVTLDDFVSVFDIPPFQSLDSHFVLYKVNVPGGISVRAEPSQSSPRTDRSFRNGETVLCAPQPETLDSEGSVMIRFKEGGFLCVRDGSGVNLVKVDKAAEEDKGTWTCSDCTVVNSIYEQSCSVCGKGWGGRLEVPQGSWMCREDLGGCSLFNSDAQFYCDICGRARPDVANSRF